MAFNPPIPFRRSVQRGIGLNETMVGILIGRMIAVPPTLQPSFEGRWTKNLYQVRGRLEAKGNDPDSGYKPLRVTVAS